MATIKSFSRKSFSSDSFELQIQSNLDKMGTGIGAPRKGPRRFKIKKFRLPRRLK